jgi:hypothetical protein
MTFLLVWDTCSYTGVSLWYFHVQMYYNPIGLFLWFVFILLCPFPTVVSSGLRFLYSWSYREYINYIQVLSFLW